jgi:hypothetical protein
MDSTVESGRQHPRDMIDTSDFAALFTQLDQPEACAPIEIGFSRLLTAMERLDRSERAPR